MTAPHEEKHLRFMARTRPIGLDKEAVDWAIAEIERLRLALMYNGPVEPDSGPDVLGERKE
jgi:hypothetical protein